MRLKSRKAVMYLGIAMVFFLIPILPATVGAGTTNEQNRNIVKSEDSVRTASYVENERSVVAAPSQENTNNETSLFKEKAVAYETPYIEVKLQADDSSDIVGKLFENNIADVIVTEGEWTKVVSGNVNGYVETSRLCFDEEAEAIARLNSIVTGTVISDSTTVYASVANFADIVEVMGEGMEVTPVNYIGDYLAVELEDNTRAYIGKEYVSISYGFETGLTIAEEEEILAAQEAARLAAEEAVKAAEEARIAAVEAKRAKETALKQKVLANTTDGKSFTYNPTISVSDEELWILACIIDWESGWESYEGKLAVANVVLNRIRSSHYPNSVSGVVYQKGQFGGVLTSSGGVSDRFAARLSAGPRTTECMEAAMAAVSGVNNIGGYTSFIGTSQANYAAYPNYTVIGGHCFH